MTRSQQKLRVGVFFPKFDTESQVKEGGGRESNVFKATFCESHDGLGLAKKHKSWYNK